MSDEVLVNLEEGVIILVVGMFIVFFALLLLFSVFQYAVPPLLSFSKRMITITREHGKVEEQVVVKAYDTGEEVAAVTAAVYLYLEEVHDEENAVVTISKSIKDYSPWSSKIYVTHNVLGNTRKQ